MRRALRSSCKKLLWQVPLAITAIYLSVLISFSSEPEGAVASFAIFKHSPSDVAEFKDGVVMHRTCCGDSPWGTYSQRADGRWIWEKTDTTDFRVTTDGRRLPFWNLEPNTREESETVKHEIELHPGYLTIRLSCVSEPSYNCTLRRRLTWRYFLL